MSFGPKPVNYTLNRDMLGKVLMHTREGMVDEVEKMTFKTLNGTLTIAQVRSFLARSDLHLCYEPSCQYNVLQDNIHYNRWYQCTGCKTDTCLYHSYFVNRGSGYLDNYTCDKCQPIACVDCGVRFQYSDDRVAVHRCNVANN
jgi:hypothetical protein